MAPWNICLLATFHKFSQLNTWLEKIEFSVFCLLRFVYSNIEIPPRPIEVLQSGAWDKYFIQSFQISICHSLHQVQFTKKWKCHTECRPNIFRHSTGCTILVFSLVKKATTLNVIRKKRKGKLRTKPVILWIFSLVYN